jgi:hypothetical protein
MYLSMSSLMGFCSLLGQPNFEGLIIFLNVNHKGADIVLVTVAH